MPVSTEYVVPIQQSPISGKQSDEAITTPIHSWLSDVTDRSTVLRDVEERGRDIEGCIKQWFAFVKPNFERYVEPQRKVAGV